MQADVSNEEEISSVFREVERTMPPVRGVIHAAGALATALWCNRTGRGFAK